MSMIQEFLDNDGPAIRAGLNQNNQASVLFIEERIGPKSPWFMARKIVEHVASKIGWNAIDQKMFPYRAGHDEISPPFSFC